MDATASPSEDWLEVAVEVAGIDAETAADIFRQACPGGVAIEPASRLDRETDNYVVDGDSPATVKGYLRPGPEADRVQESLRTALQMAPLVSPARWMTPREIKEEDWRDSWKKHFGLQRIGRGIVIAPSWIEYAVRDGETVIRIDPGMAFGTGQHPTTAMCLRSLEDLVRPGARVLDLGCGSGILSIAAAHLGAARVLALDIDPLAVSATQSNAAANGASEIIEAREGSLGESASFDSGFDVAAANISGLTLERLAQPLARALAPGGALVASGFLDESVAGVRAAFESAGLATEDTLEDGVWRGLVCRRPPGG